MNGLEWLKVIGATLIGGPITFGYNGTYMIVGLINYLF